MEGPALLVRDVAFPPPHVPTRGERLAVRVLQLAAVAVVLAVGTWKAFELDRFFVPKELVLHLAAATAGVLALGALRRSAGTRADRLLLLFLALGFLSAVFAENHWLAARALAITVSSIVLYRVARALAAAGLERPLVAALALAVVLSSLTSLAQAYGVRTDFFSLNRAPGGTLGNRNFVAHAAAFGLPLVLLAALRAHRARGWLLWSAGAALTTAALVLTRSRAGWLAVAAALAVLTLAIIAAPVLRRDGRTWLRLGGIVLLLGAGVGGALLLPNTLRWRSENPYLESMRGVADFQQGSGRGRLVQYARSARMAAAHPLLGVGPGNWSVVYPEYAAPRDPSLDRSAPGTTSNPWPSSDWVAYVAERGLLATACLALALLAIARAAVRTLRGDDLHAAAAAAARLATLAAALVAGLFDAVLLLALPAFITWTALGALGADDAPPPATHTPAHRTLLFAALAIVALAGALRSTAQLVAMPLHASGAAARLRLASRIDPGNYRVHLRLARNGNREQRCRHALAARDLMPRAEAARRLARRCD